MVYSLFSQTGDTQNLLAKIAITLESYKIVEWNFTGQLILSKCVLKARMTTLVLLVFQLSAHDQWDQWTDNSKTKSARVFILAHEKCQFRLLVILHPHIYSIFFLSNFQTVKIRATFLTGTLRPRKFKGHFLQKYPHGTTSKFNCQENKRFSAIHIAINLYLSNCHSVSI